MSETIKELAAETTDSNSQHPQIIWIDGEAFDKKKLGMSLFKCFERVFFQNEHPSFAREDLNQLYPSWLLLERLVS